MKLSFSITEDVSTLPNKPCAFSIKLANNQGQDKCGNFESSKVSLFGLWCLGLTISSMLSLAFLFPAVTLLFGLSLQSLWCLTIFKFMKKLNWFQNHGGGKTWHLIFVDDIVDCTVISKKGTRGKI